MSKLNTLATHFHTYNLVRKEELIPCLYSQRQTVAKSQGWVTWQWQVPLRTAIKFVRPHLLRRQMTKFLTMRFKRNRSMNKIISQTERSVPSAPVHEEQNPAIPMHEMVEKTLGRTGGVYDKTFCTVPIRLRVRTVKSYLVYYISILNLP